MTHNEPKWQRITNLAERIYSTVYGCDFKPFHATKVGEIIDWLSDGDEGKGRTVKELADEWIKYDGIVSE